MIIFLILTFILSFLCFSTILFKPLYNDDGTFLFYAKFYNRGFKLYNFADPQKDFSGFGIGGMEHIFYILAKIFKGKSVRFFKTIQIVWLSLIITTVSYYIILVTQNYFSATIAFLFTLLVALHPKHNFHILLGETYYLLQFFIINILLFYYIQTSNEYLILISGILAAWMMLSKIVALPIVGYYVIIIFILGGIKSSGIYLTGIILSFLVANIYILFKSSWYGMIYYNRGYWIQLTIKLKIIFKKHAEIEDDSYVARMHNESDSSIKNLKKTNLKLLFEHFGSYFLLSVLALIYGLIARDWLLLMHLGNFVIFYLIVKIQGFYFITKLNSMLFPVIVSTTLMLDKILLDSNSIKNSIFIIAIILFTHYKLIIDGSLQFKKENRHNILGFKYFGYVLVLSKQVGLFINKKTKNKNEKMIVWGNLPNIYFYADLAPISSSSFFMYPAKMPLYDRTKKNIFTFCKYQAPKWYVGANYFINDNWTIKDFSENTGIPYKHIKTFSIKNSVNMIKHKCGKNYDLPIFERDDRLYQHILIRRIMTESQAEMEEYFQYHKSSYEYWNRYNRFKKNIKYPIYEKIKNQSLKDYYQEKIKNLYPDNEFLISITETIGLSLDEKIDLVNKNSIISKNVIMKNVILSYLFKESGNIEQAKQNLEETLIIDKSIYFAHLDYGEIVFSLGDFESAFDSFSKAIKINELCEEAFNNIGVVFINLGKLKEAERFFNKAIQLKQDFIEAKANLAFVMKKKDEY